MTGVEGRLRELGDRLAFEEDDEAFVEAVLVRLDEPAPGGRPWVLRAAAVAVVVLAVVTVAVPSARRTVAGWFGFGSVEVERVPDLEVPDAAPSPAGLPGPGETVEVDVDGVVVLVSTFSGSFEDGLVTKSVAASTQVSEIDVDGAPGLWISGAPHEIGYRSADGDVVFERFAGNTLLWQDGDVIGRIEGAPSLDDALRIARDVRP